MSSVVTFQRCLRANIAVEGFALITLLIPGAGHILRYIIFGAPEFTFPLVIWAVCLAAFLVAAIFAHGALASLPKGKSALPKRVVALQARPTLALFATYHVCLSAIGCQLIFNALTGADKQMLLPFALPFSLSPLAERLLIPVSLLIMHGGLAVLSVSATLSATRDIAANKD